MSLTTINQINWNNILLQMGTIESKVAKDLTFLELVSTIFYEFYRIYLMNENQIWVDCWKEFEIQMEEQNKKGWPNLTLIKKQHGADTNKHKLVAIADGPFSFIKTNNILMMLIRIIHIEKYKETKRSVGYSVPVDKSFLQYVLGKKTSQKIDAGNEIEILFVLLKKHIEKYLTLYNDGSEFENQMGKFILDLFEL
jgi:hypothetical protein